MSELPPFWGPLPAPLNPWRTLTLLGARRSTPDAQQIWLTGPRRILVNIPWADAVEVIVGLRQSATELAR
jgi:hypothetical protein